LCSTLVPWKMISGDSPTLMWSDGLCLP
jgi:hypothetical protein